MDAVNEKNWEKLWSELVPAEGNCRTLEGEYMRAATRIRYRCFNDGDHPMYGYGVETSGPALMFLMRNGRQFDKLTGLFDDIPADGYYEDLCEHCEKLCLAVLEYVLSRGGKYTPNTIDLFEYSAQAREHFYVDEEEEEDEEGYW